jgi:anti-sigma regulatory factor (Ser/Thr protein kinase)
VHRERDFQAAPQSVTAVRRFVRETLTARAIVDDVVLVASELAANAVRHAHTPFTVKLIVNGGVRMEVSDGSARLPSVANPDESFRGLRLVGAASQDWGFDVTDHGKTVWVEFAGA